MPRNFLLIVLRNFNRYPVYSIINVSGLMLGLTCSIFIFLWISDELSFNSYHNDNVRVFKLMESEFFSDGSISTDHWTPPVLAETLLGEIPEVEQASRMAWSDAKLFKSGEKSNYEYGNYADKSIFQVLNLPLVAGNINNAVPDNHAIAISKKMADRYFDKASALGKTFRLNNSMDVTVTAVFEIPHNVTEEFDFILPFDQYLTESELDPHQWDNGWLMTFVKLKASEMETSVNQKIQYLIQKNHKDLKAELFLFPMKGWRLYDNFENGKQAGGRINYIISFSFVALFILLIACINFMNLSTARSAIRAKEVGIRKVAGASRKALIRQFMSESILLSFISLFFALVLVHLLLPAFNDFTGKRLFIDYFNPLIFGTLLLITLLTGFLAGSYPSYFLSSFRPALVLKGFVKSDFNAATLRKVLVVFQFGLSMIIIVCALVVSDQINYMRNKNLGFDRSNLLYIRTNPEVVSTYQSFRNEILQQPVITSVAMGAANPMEINGSIALIWDGKPSEDNTEFNIANCDYDYLTTMGFTLIEGRNFSRDFPADSNSLIVSEGVVRKAGFTNPIGQRLRWEGGEGHIIGVIEDFHNLGIKDTFQPTVLTLGQGADLGRWASIFVRYDHGKAEEALNLVRGTYKKHNPDFPIQWNFLDEDFEYQFRSELMVGVLSKCFTMLAIIISCLGLFGLTLFNTERRGKEISVRKVLGASTGRLATLLCSDFIQLVVYAIIISSPVAYFLSAQFLNEYVYHTALNTRTFLLPAIAMVTVSLAIIAYQSVKAAMRNPVEAMRTE